jgi:hypothetical protein
MVSGSCIQFLQEQSDVWSQLAEIRTPPIVTSDFIYVRLIGDRSIQEEDFGTVQIDRIKEMKKVARNFRRDSNTGGDMSGVKFSIVAANNHYAGFGPGTVNIFRQLLGLEEVNGAMNLSPQMT